MTKTVLFPGNKSRLVRRTKLDPVLVVAVVLLLAGIGYVAVRAFADQLPH